MKHIKELRSHELSKYSDHLKSLDTDSKYLRFCGSVNDSMIDELIEKMKTNDKHKVFVIYDADLKVIAAAHVVLDEPVELSFSVNQKYRNKGYGRKLMEYCIQWCQNRSIRVVQMMCLRSNSIIRRLAITSGMKLETEGTESSATAELASPTLSTITNELIYKQFAEFDYVNKMVANLCKLNFKL